MKGRILPGWKKSTQSMIIEYQGMLNWIVDCKLWTPILLPTRYYIYCIPSNTA